MKMTILLGFVAVLVFNVQSHADNPIVQTVYTADPAPIVYHDRVYLYTGHDEDKSTWFTMNEWRCYSSDDMVNWTDHGSQLAVRSFSWARADAWAGQVIERDGKFYYYVPMNRKNGGMSIGVAVSDSPTGPFKDAIGKPLVAVGDGNIDPTVFIDDDGQAYLFWGNPQPKYVKLNQDMISFDEKTGIVKVPLTFESFGKGKKRGDKQLTCYVEGPWLYKRTGLYYLVYAANGIPENIAYSTGPSAVGPWTFRDVIMPTEGGSFTNHPGLIDFKGKSYFFYHNGALPGGGGFTRSVCVESFEYNKDGSFPVIKMSKAGPEPVGHLNPFARVEAETICWEQGVETKSEDNVGVYITDVSDGAYIKVKAVDFGSKGTQRFLARVAGGASAVISVHLDKLESEPVGLLKIEHAKPADEWETQSTKIEGVTGVHDIYFKFGNASKSSLKFDWWQFE